MTASHRLELLAPLSGLLVPIEQVPDPVFAQKMVGDGVSIDPTSNVLLSPVAGKITQLHSARHAVTITTADGIEVLIHIGLDTVMLKGEGFSAKVKEGDTVTAGQPLIEFDGDAVSRKARSLLTQIVITNSDRVARFVPGNGFVRAGQTVALTLELAGAPAAATAAAASSDEAQSEPVRVPNPTGLHARPAAVVANLSKTFTSTVKLVRGDETANAKSVVAIMGLEVQYGDEIHVKAAGPDAAAAAKAVAEMIAQGSGEEVGGVISPAAQKHLAKTKRAVAPAKPKSGDPNVLLGVSASPGLAVGQIFQVRQEAIEVAEQGRDAQFERSKLDAALKDARNQLEALKSEISDASKAEIFNAHQELLEDPDLLDIAINGISSGKSAGFAWQTAFSTYADKLAALKNEVLAGRANDIRDVGRRVLRIIAGVKEAELAVPENAILIAEDLTPSDTASLDREKVLGFATVGGGATSHVAILARSLNIPAICGIDEDALQLANGTAVILDGSKGSLRKNPSEAEVAQIREAQVKLAKQRAEELAAAHQSPVTTDGHHIEVVANIGGLDEAKQGVELGGEGVGLLRSEFLYLDRADAPTEEEQTQIYTDIAKALGTERTFVVRTLDVGGDKPLPYLPQPAEENPFLGVRGVRLCLAEPEMFRVQIRSVLRAAPFSKLHIMFPMIATLDELRAAKAIVAEEKAALNITADVKVGIMVEVPSTAVMSELFAKEADFFSIGTNDLTQYTLAMDRGHPKLAKQADALNPGVLRLIAMTVKGAHAQGKWVGVCGGIASDPQAVPLLIGIGVDELSVSVPAIPSIKAMVRRLSKADCQKLAAEVLQLGTAAEVRERLGKAAG
ncbi:phosphoenolpyruvate--protein phosphotransferase [Jeongeupia naejangsanensis]|uniref:phosphoenolpyruvate--protein phosphotransferase n=1 Tax=Jeongeupia naejangsanensis TaxID=613195 RepID=A0ABS2BLG9_9NEIS|nr:phosphoenolpyruvate--protein phosphotransferase [Jeongeupia naejangsanensis]MBM3116460.1 phosphoenolpyruvate--protein phosphotransferase [Jeongeupia naejangsanensis]